ncbi:hypothetical protein CCACVL1_11258 [Corchorus capsularis]|uniref:Protein kinase domain-containing protein n=1 Tax=Corchorus capsularis TaxID=210143 RepID=A0A1R3IMB3_COCAP|nr:hypothetical protein CCACVL1_11258 [Corchorus capsularis]
MGFHVERIKVVGEGAYGKEKEILDKFKGNPHIVQCYDCDTTTNYETNATSLFLEFANGGSLRDLMKYYGHGQTKPKQIPEQHVKCYVEMILKGLVEIHSRGYVHSDLKPDNILVFHREDCNGLPVLKIADFGSSSEVSTGVKGIKGTLAYMSPESIHGNISGAWDVWSLGCIIIEMITGRKAWNKYRGRGQGDLDLRNELLRGEIPDIPENMSSLGKDFLMKCFIRDPDKRGTARMLLQHPFLQSETIVLPHKFGFLMSSTTKLADNNEEKSTDVGTIFYSSITTFGSTNCKAVKKRMRCWYHQLKKILNIVISSRQDIGR